VRQEAFDRIVGEEQPGIVTRRGRDRHREFAAFGRGEIDRDRLLALVETFPIEACGRPRSDWPAVEIGPAADRIEADDLGSHLGEVQAAGRAGDERRTFDDA